MKIAQKFRASFTERIIEQYETEKKQLQERREKQKSMVWT
jgi:hypothetical protein